MSYEKQGVLIFIASTDQMSSVGWNKKFNNLRGL